MKNNKTIGVKINFFTNNLKVEHKNKETLSCWCAGSVSLESNKDKGIKADVITFNSLDTIKPTILKLLKKNKILMVKG